MMRRFLRTAAVGCALVFGAGSTGIAKTSATVMTVPNDVHWLPYTAKGVPPGSFYAMLRGKETDRCDWITLAKFPDKYVYPMHVNHGYYLFTILKGTLVLGIDNGHGKVTEHALPAGSLVQGLALEPHYGRAIGETIFEIYAPCLKG